MPFRADVHGIALFAAATLAWSSAHGAAYRWVDEQGVTVYSQNPPSSVESTPVKAPAGPSAEATEEARERLRRQIEQSFDVKAEAEQIESERAKQAQTRRQRAASCEVARRNLETLENLGPRMLHMPNGEYVRPSEDEVEQHKQHAREQIEAFCD